MSYCAAQNGGVLTASYDMGKGVQSVDEPRYGVDDGRYHVARFRRHGANASLQLDNHSPRSITPSGIHVNGAFSHGVPYYCYRPGRRDDMPPPR